MDWMRCNSCWLKIEAEQSLTFHLTQCGHVYCDKCIGKAEERCCQCGSTGTISLSLKEPLSNQIAHYFTPASQLLDKLVQAMQFQQAQLDLCMKRSDETERKYQILKEAYWAGAENLKKIHQKYQKLKMAVAAMQKDTKKFNTSISLASNASQYHTPPHQINANNQQPNYPYSYFEQKPKNLNTGEHVFRVPTITKVPRSANSGYYTASLGASSNSSRGLNTSNSTISKY